MSSNNFGVGVPFVFDGQNYQMWAIKMKAYLRGLDLWDVVETGSDPPPLRNNPTEAQMKHHAEECTKKFKSLSIIHAAVTETIFTQIMACETGKEAWDKLRDEFQGSEKTKQMQVLNLRREFELLGMKESESVKEYVDRLMKTVNQIRLFGEYLPERRVIEKVLVSLAEKFETKLSSLEDSRDLSQLTPAELINSLQAVEQRKAYRLEEPSESTFVANQKGKTQATSGGKKPAGEKNDKEKKVWEGMAHRQVQINTKIKHKEKMQVGPFFVSEMEDARDLHLIQYVFDLSCESCTVFSSPRSFLKQPEFNTLKPQTQLDSLVIDIFADILTYNERKKNTMPLNWYLPVTFSTAAISGDVSSFVNFVERQKIRKNYMSDLIYCEKMFIPVHIKKGSLGHFYLYIIHLKNGEVEIWDSLFDQFINKQERHETTQKLLDALNELFKDDIWSPGWSFTKFHLRMADNILLQSNGYDCGIFVVNFMQQSPNYVNRNLSFQFDSDEERLDLTLKLLKSELNKERETLYEKAVERHNAEGGNEEDLDVSGSKRKRDDSCKIFSSVDVGEDKSNDDLAKDAGKGIMRGVGGRPKAEVWEHVRVLEGLNKVECNYCGFRFAKSANRIKSHLGLIERNGIKPCPQYHQANIDFTKRVKGDSDTTSSNLGKNPINSKGHGKGYLLPTTDLAGKQFQSHIEQIWKWIMEDEVSAIGVWGMGGAGKTALVTHIHNKLLEEDDGHFDHVIWVTVSQHDSICQLPKSIAKSIGLDISDECDVKRIAGKLLHAFKQMNRCVLILDEVWDHILLENLGFPVSDKGIKFILTTRVREVCQSMNCEEYIVEVEPLDQGDGWDLFKRTLGVHQTLSPEVEKVASDIACECGGLPLAIVTIARRMKGQKNLYEWNRMLECLQGLENGQYDMDKYVFPVLRFSYDHLDSKLQECFLYCVSCAEDMLIGEFLKRDFVYEGWIDGTKSLGAQHNEFQSILEKLYSSSLLKTPYDFTVELHPLVRAMGFSIMKEDGKIMAKANMNLTEIPDDSRWKEDLQKVFLSGNNIQKIPDDASPRCSQLSTLHLGDNEGLELIPDDFFSNMPALRILDLSTTGIESLPTSVSNLECLVALLLSRCYGLSHVPSLAKLQRLIWLDLSETAITEAPPGLELLINLRHLDFEGTEHLKMTTASIIPKLTNLQSLYLNCFSKSMDVTAQDLEGLKKLKDISASFCNVEKFNEYVLEILGRDHVPQNYRFIVTKTKLLSHDFIEQILKSATVPKLVVLVGLNLRNKAPALPEDIQELRIYECHQWWRYLWHNFLIRTSDNPCKIHWFEISTCNDLEYLCCFSPNCSFCSSVQLVGRLTLEGLKDLQKIVEPTLAPPLHLITLFSHLRYLKVFRCDSMKTLLTPALAAQLRSLETIKVRYCGWMKEIVSDGSDLSEMVLPSSGNHSDHAISLPKLNRMTLTDLPELNYVYRGIMLCPSLKSLVIRRCEKLTQPPQIQAAPQIEKIPGGYLSGN